MKTKTKLTVLFLFLIAAAVFAAEYSYFNFNNANKEGNQLTGFATVSENTNQPENINSIGIEVGTIGTYFMNPSFRAKADYDIEVYDSLVKQAKSFVADVELCGKNNMKDTNEIRNLPDTYGNDEQYKVMKSDTEKCVETNLPEKWIVDCEKKDTAEDDYFLFCYPTGNYVFDYDAQSNMEKKEIIIKFALHFARESTLEYLIPDCEDIKSQVYSYSCQDTCSSSSRETTEGICRADLQKKCCEFLSIY